MDLGGWVIFYLAITLVIGLAATRLIHNSTDFLSAGRKLPFVLSSFALFALWFGSETIFGASSAFLKHGLLGVMQDPFGGVLCLLLFGRFFVKKLYRLNLLTVGDLFRKRYGHRVELISSIFMLFTFFGYIAAQLIALSILFETVFGINSATGLLISAAFVTTYTASGGMWAISITDFVQSIVIIGGLLLLAIDLTGLIEFSTLFQSDNPHFFDFIPSSANGMSWTDYLAAWATLGLGSLASQDIFQRANAAKNERVAVWSTYAGAFLYLMFAMLPLYLGLLLLKINPQLAAGDTQESLMSLVKIYAPFGLQVLFYGALISAIFSTCSGGLLAPSTILSENVLRPLFKQLTDRQFLILSRMSVIIVAIISTWLAWGQASIYELVAQSSILGMVSILVPFAAALFWDDTSKRGALISMFLGLIAYFIPEYLVPIPFPSMFVGLIASILGYIVGKLSESRLAYK